MADKKITVYSKNPCVQCTATKRKLDDLQAEYTVADATTAESLDEILALDSTYRQAPVTKVEVDGVVIDHWTGYNPDKLEEHAAA